jgi:hypothetical protein
LADCCAKSWSVFCLTGMSSQKILLHMKKLAMTAFSEEMDEDLQNIPLTRQRNETLLLKWKGLCDNLIQLWKVIEKRAEYTSQDIGDLHMMSNQFMDQWMDMLGSKHMANHIHIIGSGHLIFFAKKYRNLYRFSQQGWESLNQLLKHYYFNNTNHGGSVGNGGKSNGSILSGDHCRPLLKLCKRSLMGKLGFGDTYFQSLQDSKVSTSPMNTERPLCDLRKA